MILIRRTFSNLTKKFTPISTSVTKKITKNDVENFAKISGDTNPVHFGENAIVHGAFLNSLVSAVIGTKLPGPGTIVVSQTLKFPSECRVNDVVTIKVDLIEARKLYLVTFKCTTDGDKVVLEGDAKLVPPKKCPT